MIACYTYMDGMNMKIYLIKRAQFYDHLDNINLNLKKYPKLFSKRQRTNFSGMQHFNTKCQPSRGVRNYLFSSFTTRIFGHLIEVFILSDFFWKML